MDSHTRESREITGVADWLDWRRAHITASRVAALFGAHPYLDRDRLAADLRGERNRVTTPAMRRGRILEPAVLAALAEDHPDWQITRATTYHWLPDHRIGATPDAWLDDDALVQIKTVSPEQFEKWQGRVPLVYTLQTLTELLVTGRTRGVLAVMVCSPSYPVHEYEIARHDAAEQKILDAVAGWWRSWDAGEIAAPVPAEPIAADLDDGSHRDLSGDNLLPTLLPERAMLKATVSKAEARLKEIDYEIRNRIGPARTGWLPGWSLSFATQHRKETLIPAKDIRVLRIKETMEADSGE